MSKSAATALAPVQRDWIDDALAGLPPIVKLTEAANVMRMSTRNVRREIDKGHIEIMKLHPGIGSSRVLIARRELERFLRLMVVTA